jgi:hypothetical protein
VTVGAKKVKEDSKATDFCYAKLRLVNTTPAYMKSFAVSYSFGILSAKRQIEHATEPVQALSSELIPLSGPEIPIITKSVLKLQESKLLADVDNSLLTIVCLVR